MTAASTSTAGKARDDDVEDGDDSVDDGLENGTDSVDDSHQGSADGAEHRGDLELGQSLTCVIQGRTYARYDGTHCDMCESVCFMCVCVWIVRNGQVG